jgi:mycothiol S-conjugate amidase
MARIVQNGAMNRRLLHVHAHPDDESSKGAATTAYYVAQGVDVMVATCTGGERGSILNPKMESPENWANLAELRRAEMVKAAQILGISQVWLGYVDSGLPEGEEDLPPEAFARLDPEVAAGPLVKVIRDFKPQVMTTYDENGGYPHPDHIMCHKISMAAVTAAADPAAWPEHGEPWQVAKVYYDRSLHRGRFAALDAAMHEAGLGRPYTEWLQRMPSDETTESRLTTFVPCSEFFEVRNAALLAHATQIDPDGSWFAVPLEMQKAGWPTEDFELVRSTVAVKLPESDLFAGLQDAGEASLGAWCYSI